VEYAREMNRSKANSKQLEREKFEIVQQLEFYQNLIQSSEYEEMKICEGSMIGGQKLFEITG
jgi:hypothetical protein